MSDPVVEQIQQADTQAAQTSFKDPYDFLATIPGAPSRSEIQGYKVNTPNGRLKVFSPDGGKRVFIVRGISGMQLQTLEKQIPQNLGAGLPDEQRAARIMQELQYLVGAACTCWTNATTTNKLTSEDLRNGSAGLPKALNDLISWLSDFVEPEAMAVLSADL